MSDTIGRMNMHYIPKPAGGGVELYLVSGTGTSDESRYTFFDEIGIGRLASSREAEVGTLLINDPRISRDHCVITQTRDGRCRIRDTSRNGTWLDGRRLVPNVEVELEVGQVIRIANLIDLSLQGQQRQPAELQGGSRTVTTSDVSMVTVLVGDIRDYTGLVQKVDSETLHRSVARVFRRLEDEVTRCGGTVKEYPGDAIVAFWDKSTNDNFASSACRGALALDRVARRMATDRDYWDVPGFPLRLDWALASGCVVIKPLGGDRPSGLSMIGEAAVLAFRIEKLADETTGSILACGVTRTLAADGFVFRDLGKVHAKGFDDPTEFFSLVEVKEAQHCDAVAGLP